MTKDSISNYRTNVKGYKNASSPVNRVCGRIPHIPPESATANNTDHVDTDNFDIHHNDRHCKTAAVA